MKHIRFVLGVTMCVAVRSIGAQDTTAVKRDSAVAKADTAVARPDTAMPKPDTAAAKPAPAPVDSTHTVKIGSPYEDFVEKQELSLFGGRFTGNEGSAGVGPQASPIIGVAYTLNIGGPASVVGRFSYAPSQRTLKDPLAPAANQDKGLISAPLYMLDVGLHVSLTGEKTWHRLLPYAGFALGAAFGGSTPDVGGYYFGSAFYFAFGAGTKIVINDTWLLRLDAWDYFWQVKYPTTYFPAGGGVAPILAANAPDKEWLGNGIFTFGVCYVLTR